MKRKELINDLQDFREKQGSCYCYIEGAGFYNIAFVLPCLNTDENIVVHNGASGLKNFKIYETISPKKFKRRLKFYCTYEEVCKLSYLHLGKNVVFTLISEFNTGEFV